MNSFHPLYGMPERVLQVPYGHSAKKDYISCMRAEELKAARKGLGLSQPQFAEAINAWWAIKSGDRSGYNQPRISAFERGERSIPVKIQWFISDAGNEV
jgi:hypothetical protein